MRPALEEKAKRAKASRRNARKSRVEPAFNPYVAIMQPLVIVPVDPQAKVVTADAGSIVKLLDQRTLYRDRTSPITHRADEVLVEFGKPKEPQQGWISGILPADSYKPVQGPTFLVTTSAETGISAWDSFRLKIARTRKTSPNSWFAPWLVLNGKKYPNDVRAITRQFGGKTVKNEEFAVRCARLFQLILHTEIDMSAKKAKETMAKKAKKTKSTKEAPVEKVIKKTKEKTQEKIAKKMKKVKPEAEAPKKKAKSGKQIAKEVVEKKKKVKKGKATTQKGKNIEAKEKAVAKKGKPGEFRANNRDHDDYIVKRLIQENPRREGTHKAKVWSLLKKGMTVRQFVEKGGGRTEIQRYIESGWVKLLRPSASE